MDEQLVIGYGRSRRTMSLGAKRRLAAAAVIGVLGLAGGGLLLYWAEWIEVRSTLGRVPNITFQVHGYSDVGWNAIYATVTINNKPNSHLSFQSPTGLDTGEIRLSEIGPYELWAHGGQDWFQIGPGGAFSNLLPVQVKSVEDVVKNYDQLRAAVDAMPKEGHHTSSTGATVPYAIYKRGQ